ncbi:MAG: DNA mismatch repair protein MutS [Myxococcales bacterium]|nr:DNA mismatch repair protein MutS [Myxococcales bacterium]
MRQYRDAKAKYPDAALFFRLGDFYELFFEDAVTVARALDLTLTARNKGAADEIPMCGVPYHAASQYIQRLLDQGFKVAICEQMADPATVKGIVPREVVRVVTPALVFDDLGLEASKNSYLVAVEHEPGAGYGVAALDASTGELLAAFAADEGAALAEIARADPREVLLSAGAASLAPAVKAARPRAAVRDDREALTEVAAVSLVDVVIGAGEAARSGCEPLAVIAAARCLRVARACEIDTPLPIRRLVRIETGSTLVLDESTQQHLELVRSMDGSARGALLTQLDATRTAPGARLLRRRLLAPLTDVAAIRRRLDAVEVFVTAPGLRAEVRALLDQVRDVERLAATAVPGRAAPRDLAALRGSLAVLPGLERAIAASKDPAVREALAGGSGELVDTCDALRALLDRALVDEPPIKLADGGVVREGYDAQLDEVRALAQGGQRLIVELEARMREATGVSSLKLRYTRVFGWYIEVTKSNLGKVPKTWRRKQTIATGERYTTDELDDLADKLAHAEVRTSTREAELFGALVDTVGAEHERLAGVAARLAEWDVAAALAEIAHQGDFARPTVDDSSVIEVEDGRHPVVERLAAAGRFVPNDVLLDASARAESGRTRLWLLTGPNMSGKSTFMRQVAIAVVLAQMGSFVPARRAHVGVVDRVLTRVGASDNLSLGESTFMVEMKETANVLARATSRSLVVLDEIGRGTSTYDGLAIAWAVAEYLHDVVRCRALFATHYHELTRFVQDAEHAQNYSVAAREHEGTIVFFHRVELGAASRSYGVACARLAGLPEPVLARARAILDGLETFGEVARGPTGKKKKKQLGLFATDAPAPATHPALDTLRALDCDRLTPLDALNMLASLKRLAETP